MCARPDLWEPWAETPKATRPEGGYGADEPVSPVEVGAGEQMMKRALMNIYELLGRIKPAPQAE